MLLDGRVAVVTGAASARGIGKATARLMAAHGARVVLLDLDTEATAAAARDVGAEALGFGCDVTDKPACDAAIERILAAHGRIDVLVNNAGITQRRLLLEIEPEDYAAVTDVSLRGSLYMAQAVVPAMRRQRRGSIVCISSVSAQRGGGIVGGPHYAAAKAGVLGLVKAMARELGPDGIRANAVTPGLVDTDILTGKLDDAARARIAGDVPLGRLGAPDDIAGACVFLASDLSAYVTGAVLDVNGGLLIH